MHLKQVFKDTQLQKFKKLAKMKDLMRLIKEQCELHGSHKVVEIKLHSFGDKANSCSDKCSQWLYVC